MRELVFIVVLFQALVCFTCDAVSEAHNTVYDCDKLYSDEPLDLSEMKKIPTSDAPNFVDGLNDVAIYEDKDGNNWYIKHSYTSHDGSIRQYIGGQILHAYLGKERSGVTRFVKGKPSTIATLEVKNYTPAAGYLLEKYPDLGKKDRGPVVSYLFDLDDYEKLEVAMDFVELGDRHLNNIGFVEENGQLLAARVDYDDSFTDSLSPDNLFILLRAKNINYEKLEQAIEHLLAMPDCVYENIIKNYNSIDHLKEINEIDRRKYLGKLNSNKELFTKLIPLVKVMKVVLGENGEEFVELHKDQIQSLRGDVYEDMLYPMNNLERLLVTVVSKDKEKVLDKICEIEELRDAIASLNETDYVYSEVTEAGWYLSRIRGDSSANEGDRLMNKLWTECKLPFQVKANAYTFSDPFELAVSSSDLEQLKKFFELGVDPAKAPGILSLAVDSECTEELFKLLLENGFSQQLKDEFKGETPLHKVAKKGQKDLYDLFLEYGACPEALDSDGKTASEYMLDNPDCS